MSHISMRNRSTEGPDDSSDSVAVNGFAVDGPAVDESAVDGPAVDEIFTDDLTVDEPARDDFGPPPFVDLRQYHEPGYNAGGSRLKMLTWWLIQAIGFPLSSHFGHGFRCWLLRCFGARIGMGVRIRPTARFTYPWNIEIGDYSWVGDDAVFYSLAPIRVGQHCVISQKSYLCTGSHDIADPRFALLTGAIVIENGVWIAADCFVAASVRIGANAVIAARSTVFTAMPRGQVCWGTPCKPVKPRQRHK